MPGSTFTTLGGGDVSVVRMLPSTSSRRNTSSTYTYRTIERSANHLRAVAATSSYLTSRPTTYTSSSTNSTTSSVLSDFKPLYSSGSYRSRYLSMNSTTAPSSTSTSTSLYSSYRSQSNDNDRENSSVTNTYRPRDYRRLDGGSTIESVRSRLQRLDSKDSSNSISTCYRYDRLQSDKLTQIANNLKNSSVRNIPQSPEIPKRLSVAEMRRMFESKLKGNKKDSDDEEEENSMNDDSKNNRKDEDINKLTSAAATVTIQVTNNNNNNNNNTETIPSAAAAAANATPPPNALPPLNDNFLINNEANDLEPSVKSKKAEDGLVGLKNIGNTCFMNTVLQCLSNTKELLEYFLTKEYLQDVNKYVKKPKENAPAKAFATLLNEIWAKDTDVTSLDTLEFKNQIQKFAPRFMGYLQQDSQEFLKYLLEGLHEDLNRVKIRPPPILTDIDESLSIAEKSREAWKRYIRRDNSKISDLFYGLLRSTLKCTVCQHSSDTFDPFSDLSVPIPSNNRASSIPLSSCLDLFTKEEVLDGDEKPMCGKCQGRQKCTKSLSIHQFPEILVIHIKRFGSERFRTKLNTAIEYPIEDLDVTKYNSPSQIVKPNSEKILYNLYAVAVHSGTVHSGHYVAFCKHPYSELWYEYNDSRISSLAASNVNTKDAYILFYQAVHK